LISAVWIPPMDTGKPTPKMAGYKVPETFGDVMISQMLHVKNIFTTWKGSMAQLPFVLVYHSPENYSPPNLGVALR